MWPGEPPNGHLGHPCQLGPACALCCQSLQGQGVYEFPRTLILVGVTDGDFWPESFMFQFLPISYQGEETGILLPLRSQGLNIPTA